MAWIEVGREEYSSTWGTLPKIEIYWRLTAYRDDATNHLKIQSYRRADYVSGTFGYYILSGTWIIDESYLKSQYIKQNLPSTWTSLSVSDEWELGEYTGTSVLGAVSFQTNSTGRDTVHARLTVSAPLLEIGTNDETTGIIVPGDPMTGIQLTNASGNIYPMPAFPIGYIYVSYGSASPASMFGGVWERIVDKFLLGAGTTYVAGSTGGAATVTLTTDQIPSHAHSATAYYTSGGYDGVGVWELSQKHSNSFDNRTTSSTGGSGAHNNLPPYVTVRMWKKLASTPELNVAWNVNYSISDSTGEPVASNNYYVSDKIAIEPGYTYTIYGWGLTSSETFSIYPKFYDANHAFLGTGMIADGHGWSNGSTGDLSYVLNPFDGAKYFRMQGYAADASIPPTKITIEATYTG